MYHCTLIAHAGAYNCMKYSSCLYTGICTMYCHVSIKSMSLLNNFVAQGQNQSFYNNIILDSRCQTAP